MDDRDAPGSQAEWEMPLPGETEVTTGPVADWHEDLHKLPTFVAGAPMNFSFDPSRFHEAPVAADGDVKWARYHDEFGRPIGDFDLTLVTGPAETEACPRCGIPTVPPRDRVSVRRESQDCGVAHYHTQTSPTEGLRVRQGETMVIPAALATANMRFAQGASFTPVGVDWLARELFGLTARRDVDSMFRFLQCWKELADNTLREDTCSPLSRATPGVDQTALQDFVTRNPESNVLTALVLSSKVEELRTALTGADEHVRQLALDVFRVCAAQSVMAFRYAAAEACLRGNALERLRWLVSHWNNNLENGQEAFWQDELLRNPLAISQLFASPIVVHHDKYYVGGTRGDGAHGKYADFLYRSQLTDSAIILEIKTPAVELLRGTEYRRDVFPPSPELVGAVQQVLDQRAKFLKSIDGLQGELETDEPRIETAVPECLVIIGNGKRELVTRAKRRSFEAYRRELRSVRVLTFDELFGRLESLLELLGSPLDTST